MTITLIERPISEGSRFNYYTCEMVECATLAELEQAVQEFKYRLNPYKNRHPRIGWATFTLAGHKIRLDVREAQRGFRSYARACFLMDGTRATWTSICKALARPPRPAGSPSGTNPTAPAPAG